MKEYNITTRLIKARPRSERLRRSGYGEAAGEAVAVSAGNTGYGEIYPGADDVTARIKSLLSQISGISDVFTPIDVEGNATTWLNRDSIASVRCSVGFWSTGFVSALGRGGDGGSGAGGGGGADLLVDWSKYDAATGSTLALGANLGEALRSDLTAATSNLASLTGRVAFLEGKNYLDELALAVTGGGNAVTDVALSSDRKLLTVTKGATFSLNSHTHSQYLTAITKAQVEAVLRGDNITSHGHEFLHNFDCRDEETTTLSFPKQFRYLFKMAANVGLNPKDGYFTSVLHFSQWSDLSGGKAKQLALTDDGHIYLRYGFPGSDWSEWRKIIDESNIDSFLADYLKTNEANSLYQPKGSYITESNLISLLAHKCAYSCANGILVKTIIPESATAMVTLLIEGNGYGLGAPIKSSVVFYNYGNNGVILNYSATHFGLDFGEIKAFVLNGYVCVWFQQSGQFQSFFIRGMAQTNATDYNIVSAVNDSEMPTDGVTRLVTIKPKIAAMQDWVQSWGNSNYVPLTSFTTASILDKIKTVDGSGSGLDADLLDGLHESSFLRAWPGTSVDQESSLWSQIGIKPYYAALPDGLTGPYVYGAVISLPTIYSRLDIYYSDWSTKDISNNGIYVRSGWEDDRKPWKHLAFTTDNVASATKLATTRSLWGQPFDGTAAVGGSLSGVGAIAMNGALTGATNIQASGDAVIGNAISGKSLTLSDFELTQIHLRTTDGGSCDLILNDAGRLSVQVDEMLCTGSLAALRSISSEATIYAAKGIWSDGYVSALGQTTDSDIRLKEIVGEAVLRLDVIANAPAIAYKWKAVDDGIHAGTIAQYWQEHLPEVVSTGRNGYLGVDYGALAHIEVVSLAREVVKLRREVDALRKSRNYN